MRISRFLLTSIFIAGALPALAQSQSNPGAPPKLPSISVFSLGSSTESPQLQAKAHSMENQIQSALERFKEQNNDACYSIRDYRFTRVAPGSNATKLSGYSTCEAASLFHLREIETPKK
jgi:hypothetical protein